MNSAEQMSADSEEILDDAVHRCKTLQMGSGLEPAHRAFPLAGRLMRDFRRLFSYCRVLWTTDGITVRCAAE